MRFHARHPALLVPCLVAAAVAPSAASEASGLYRFTYVTDQSGLNATLSASVSTSGTLIGNFDPATNPTGTRTKPGLFGSFGSSENLPVAVQDLSVAAEGPVTTRTAGSFDLRCDTVEGTVSLSGLSLDALSGGSIEIPFSVSLFTEAFRTRNPTATYPSIPLEIPVGSVTVTQLAFTQVGPAVGTITPIDGVSFDVEVTVPVELSLTATILGQAFDVSDGPVLPLPLSGVVTFAGDVATFAGSTPLQFQQSQSPGEPLRSFDLPLPTTNPDVDANVVASLVLDEIGVSMLGQLVSAAGGQRVLPPCPPDLNGDRSVDGIDLGSLLGAWGPCQPGCPGDFNSDGAVDGIDLGTLLGSWGACD
jgi:hypothetical protein